MWVCPIDDCRYVGRTAWELQSHLIHAHKIHKDEVKSKSAKCDYWSRDSLRAELTKLFGKRRSKEK